MSGGLVRFARDDIRTGSLASVLAIALAAGSIVGLAAAASGCGDSKDAGASKRTETAAQTETTARIAPKRVPSSLGTVESAAEDAIDFAHEGDRPKVVRAIRALRRAADGRAATDLRKAQVPEDRIAALQDRARLVAALAGRAELVRVSLAANQVSALMPEFYARYTDPVPPAVLKLDYLDREAQLRSQAGDRAAVRAAVRDLSSTWAALRQDVIDARGRKVAASYTRHAAAMRRLSRGSNEPSLQREAVTGLELVDQLEGVFRKK
jgi:hypothetical protein